jgi:hypothetical protein
MKVRIHDNSIRFRLTQSEVARLAAEGRVEGSVRFAPAPDDLFTYAVETSAQCVEVRAQRSEREIWVTLPENLARAWATEDQVSIEHVQRIGADALLRILVEKDFRCLHHGPGDNEGDADSFPNPDAAASRQGEP